MLSYSGLCQREGYIVNEQLVTVHCSFLYFELVSISTKAYPNVARCVT